MDNIMSLQEYYEKLKSLRKPKPDCPWDTRVTHCYIVHNLSGENHYLEVRGWSKIKDHVLSVSIVNWTICAGTATLELKEDTIHKFKIITTKERWENEE